LFIAALLHPPNDPAILYNNTLREHSFQHNILNVTFYAMPSLSFKLLLRYRKRSLQQLFLLLCMTCFQSGGDASAGISSGIHHMFPVVVFGVVQEGFDARLGKAPCSGIQRLLLTPNNRLGVGIHVEILLERLPRERIQLFDTRDCCVLVATVGAVFVESSIDLTSAENNAINFIWFGDGLAMLGIWDDPLELRFAGELFNTRSSNGVAEQRLGEKDNES
jgi:hypothetical protein